MKRKIHHQLLQWKEKNEGNLLILQGARQTGKTSCIEEFGKDYEQFIRIDLSSEKERRVFEKSASFDELMQAIYFLKDKRREGKQTLLFLDGISAAPSVLRRLPEFRRNDGKLHVIASSAHEVNSLFSGEVIPGPKPDLLRLYPYSFSEFLAAMDEVEPGKAFNEIPFPDQSFSRLIHLFDLYTLIGGMPEIVEKYAATRELADLPPIYEKIFGLFSEETGRVASTQKTGIHARNILQNTFPFASMRIKFNRYGNTDLGSRETAQAFRTLSGMLFTHLSYPAVSTHSPSTSNHEKSPRLQLLDTGLVNYFSGIQKQIFESSDLLALFNGQIVRHIAGQEILSSMKDFGELQFWVRDKPQSRAEVDFIIPFEGLMIPVVVKAGEPGRLRSLHQFMDAAEHPYAVRLHADHLSIQQAKTISGKKFYLMNLPYFLAGKIKEHLEGFIKLVNG